MFKIPVSVSKLKNQTEKRISYGNDSHVIGEHLSAFVNMDYHDFQIIKNGIYTKDDSYLISNEMEFNKINGFFKELFYICFSDSFLIKQGAKPEYIKQVSKLFTPQRRFLYFSKKHKNFIGEFDISYEIDYNWISSNWHSIPMNTQDNITTKMSSFFTDPANLEIPFISVLKYDPFCIERVRVLNYQSFLFYEFNKILEYDTQIKECKNCGLYFAPRGRSDSLYCYNLYKDSGKTCQEIGIANTYKEKINSSDIHKIFNRFYKKMYARKANKKISKDDFQYWLDKARKERDKAIKDGLSADEFSKIIDKL